MSWNNINNHGGIFSKSHVDSSYRGSNLHFTMQLLWEHSFAQPTLQQDIEASARVAAHMPMIASIFPEAAEMFSLRISLENEMFCV